MMTVKEWEEGVKAWENVKKQATIDLEQAELYISVISKKIEELKAQEVENGK